MKQLGGLKRIAAPREYGCLGANGVSFAIASLRPLPNYKTAWAALSGLLLWMHESDRLKAYWGWNLADIANDLIDRAYPGLRTGKIPAPGDPA